MTISEKTLESTFSSKSVSRSTERSSLCKKLGAKRRSKSLKASDGTEHLCMVIAIKRKSIIRNPLRLRLRRLVGRLKLCSLLGFLITCQKMILCKRFHRTPSRTRRNLLAGGELYFFRWKKGCVLLFRFLFHGYARVFLMSTDVSLISCTDFFASNVRTFAEIYCCRVLSQLRWDLGTTNKIYIIFYCFNGSVI